MAHALYSDTSISVSRLVEDIELGEIALPELQRPFVWSPAQVRDLLDSMYKGFPVGSLLFWSTGAEQGARQIGADEKKRVARYLIVDGQQRLTALYAVLKGAAVLRKDFTTGPIRIAFRPTDATFTVADAATDNDPEYLPDVSTLWQPGNRKAAVRGFLKRLSQKRDLDEPEEDRLDTTFDDLYNLEKYLFKVVELAERVDEEEVAEIFVRINSNGVKLSQADFILTLMSVYWEAGRKNLEDFCQAARTPVLSQSSPFNWHIHPDPDQLLRVTTTFALRRAVLKQVYAVLRGRDPETGKTSPALREVQFTKLQDAQKRVLDLTNWHEYLQCLERAGFRGARMISSNNAVLYTYVMWLIGRVDYKVPLDKLREAIARWFFMAQITSRYSGSFETQVEQDLHRLRDVHLGHPGEFVAALDRIVNDTLTSDFWRITLPNGLDGSGANSPTLLAYLAALNIHDADALLSTGKVRARLDPAILARRAIERHHLFPKAYLKRLGVTDTKQTNQIANMALVEWSDNGAISDNAPSVYWPAFVAAKRFSEERQANQRYWHALPERWEAMEYSEFLAARRVLMSEVVRDAYRKLSETGYQPEYPAPSAPPP
ncbi:DUF262 domain-containing protein [Embleya sp. NPDC050493]|uniref:GmrSD restriction endonuclease domain-containing protein n=1 Tax=Embleya sp. NPDC050493 TaxID=3363989 RepID=UPI0037ABA24B